MNNKNTTPLMDIFKDDVYETRELFKNLDIKYGVSEALVALFLGVNRQTVHCLARNKNAFVSKKSPYNLHSHTHMTFNLANALIIKYMETYNLPFTRDLPISIEDAININKLVLMELPDYLTNYISLVNKVIINLETRKQLFEISNQYHNMVSIIKDSINKPDIDVAKKINWLINTNILTIKRVSSFLGLNYDSFRRKIHTYCTDEFLSDNERDLGVCFLTLLLQNVKELPSLDGYGLGKVKLLKFVENMDSDSGFCADLAYNIRENISKKD